MNPEIPPLSSFIPSSQIECIDNLDIRDKDERKKSLQSAYRSSLKKKWFSASVLTLFTLGVYPYKLYKKTERDLSCMIAARKIFYYDKLLQKIEEIRKTIEFREPKSAIHYVYKKLLLDQEFPFCKIFSKSDILLCITTPIESSEYETAVREIRHTRDYRKFWRNIKQLSRHQEINYIKSINTHYSLLKNRYLLPKKEIHLRLTRTSQGKTPEALTMLRTLSNAFQEITTAFESLVALKKNNFESFEVLSSLLNLSAQETHEIYDVLRSNKKLGELSTEMLKYLISLILKKDTIISICTNEVLSHTFLTLNESQLTLLLELHHQLSSNDTFTSKVMKCFYEKLKPCDNFTSKLCPETKNHPHVTFKGKSEPLNLEVLMTRNFLDEMNTHWESIDVANENHTFSFDADPSISFDHLSRVHQTLVEIAGDDDELLILLQEALSKKGKQIISESIKNSIKEILGEDQICSDLNLKNIKIHKVNPDYLEIEYYFDKPGIPNSSFSPSVIQPFKKSEGHWSST